MANPASPPSKRLASAFGVTRLARLTGLDRLGFEVVGAVRPFGHVLQVSQGKGRTLAAAQWSALGEAIELSAAESPDLGSLRFGPAPQGALWDVDGLSVAWAPGRTLEGNRPCWVPAETVYCPPAGTCWLGPSIATWRSNGLGAHPTSKRAAVEHAVLELVERDALARTLPRGWTAPAARARLVELPPFARALQDQGIAAFAFDLTPPGAALPLAGALLFDLESDVVPLTAGYACRRSWDDAVESALLEAAQSRLTEIHGAREDVLTGEREAGLTLLRSLQGATPARARPRRERRALGAVIDAEIAVVTLREAPFVVKAVSPTMRVSELL